MRPEDARNRFIKGVDFDAHDLSMLSMEERIRRQTKREFRDLDPHKGVNPREDFDEADKRPTPETDHPIAGY